MFIFIIIIIISFTSIFPCLHGLDSFSWSQHARLNDFVHPLSSTLPFSYPPTHSPSMSFYLFPSFGLPSPLAPYKLTHSPLYSYVRHAQTTEVFLVSPLLPHYPHPSAASTHPYEFYPSESPYTSILSSSSPPSPFSVYPQPLSPTFH